MDFIVERTFRGEKKGATKTNSIWEVFEFIFGHIFPPAFDGKIGDVKSVKYTITINKSNKRG